jgi:hypothetical protein
MPHEVPELGIGPVPVEDLGETLGVGAGVVAEYLELGLAGPGRFCPNRLSVSVRDLARLSRALRLADELELHAAAAVLLVELLEERDALRRRVLRLERAAASRTRLP